MSTGALCLEVHDNISESREVRDRQPSTIVLPLILFPAKLSHHCAVPHSAWQARPLLLTSGHYGPDAFTCILLEKVALVHHAFRT